MDRMHGDELVPALVAMENRPWGEWGYRTQKPITKTQIAAILKPFGIVPKQMKLGDVNRNGYALKDLNPVLSRYSQGPTPFQGSTSLHPLQDKGLRGNQGSTAESEVEPENPRNPLKINGGREVEVQTPPCAGFNGNGALCAHCGAPAEEGNAVMPTVVSDDGEKLPLHVYCVADWFQRRGPPADGDPFASRLRKWPA